MATEKAKKALRKRKFHKAVKLDDLIVFARQMAVLLEAGVTLMRGLTLLSQQIESMELYRALEAVRKDIEAGSSFKVALSKHPKVFSQYMVSLVETGEATGQLSTIMNELARFLEENAALRRKVTSAMVYPILLLVAAIGAVIFFMLFIIPIFSGIFEAAQVELPGVTKMVMMLSDLMRKQFVVLCVITGGCGYGLYAYTKTEAGRWAKDSLALNLPVFGELLRRLASARFAGSLATLVKSGTPIINSMDILVRTADNVVVKQTLRQVRDSVKEGKGMAGPLAETDVFPILVSQMVAVGEETGELASMLNRLASFYEERVAAIVDRMVSLFEPIMLIFMGAIVGFLVIAMFLPIFQMGSVAG